MAQGSQSARTRARPAQNPVPRRSFHVGTAVVGRCHDHRLAPSPPPLGAPAGAAVPARPAVATTRRSRSGSTTTGGSCPATAPRCRSAPARMATCWCSTSILTATSVCCSRSIRETTTSCAAARNTRSAVAAVASRSRWMMARARARCTLPCRTIPFRFDQFVLGDHWDYRNLSPAAPFRGPRAGPQRTGSAAWWTAASTTTS